MREDTRSLAPLVGQAAQLPREIARISGVGGSSPVPAGMVQNMPMPAAAPVRPMRMREDTRMPQQGQGTVFNRIGESGRAVRDVGTGLAAGARVALDSAKSIATEIGAQVGEGYTGIPRNDRLFAQGFDRSPAAPTTAPAPAPAAPQPIPSVSQPGQMVGPPASLAGNNWQDTRVPNVRERVGSKGEREFTNLSDAQLAQQPRGGLTVMSAENFVRPVGTQAQPQRVDQAGGNPMDNQFRFALSGIENEMRTVQQQIEQGMSGRGGRGRLTAPGLQAMQGRLATLGQERAQLMGTQAGMINNANSERGSMDRELARNASNELVERMRQSDPYRAAQTEAIYNALDRSGLEVLQPDVPPDNPSYGQQLQTNVTAAADVFATLQQFEGDRTQAAQRIQQSYAQAVEALKNARPEQQVVAQALVDRYAAQMRQMIAWFSPQSVQRQPQSVQGYAEGGLVQAGVDPQMLRSYQQYISQAQKYGLPPISVQEFMQMGSQQPQPQQPQSVQGYADGGMVQGEDVSGRMVLDPNPNAPTDSIPAVVDGATPAALDSGEFVMPKDVVQYFGMQRLQKMIEQARRGSNVAG